MAITLIKKIVSVVPLPLWQKILLASSGALAVLVAIAAFWSWGTVGQANTILDQRMVDLAGMDERARAAGDRFRTLKQDVRALKTLLEQHMAPIAFLEFFETITHPEVYWKSLEANFKDPRRMRLTGTGKTLEDVAEQIERVRQSPLISASTFGSVQRSGSGRVDFSIEFVPAATIWQFKP